MDVEPAFNAFAQRFSRGEAQVVWTTLVADLETPVSAMLKLADDRPNSFLLESVEGGAVRGRYSFIGLNPDLIWRCRGNSAEINRQAETSPDGFQPCPVGASTGALASLRAVVAESRIELPTSLPPMAAGLVGYLGYDVVRLIERLPATKPDRLGLPDGVFVRPTVICVFDNVADSVTLITPVRVAAAAGGEMPTADAAYAAAQDRLAATVREFERRVRYERASPTPTAGIAMPVSNIGPGGYQNLVARAKEYILAGDIFQVVPSQRFAIPFSLSPFALYRALRRLNPSPFLFFLNFADFAVVGSSPEIMVRVRDGKVTIRPIAGTRPRGRTLAEDEALSEELLADEKERAEHLMLLDLGRNDVGRVARVGTVKVTERMVIERYSHVMHIVSNVEGDLDPALDAIDALVAGFPAGTVSGAPKVRAMEIIEEFEPERRGIYGGCIGYISAGGDLDTCIALRTGVVKDGVLYVQAGGGIVADSDPDAEHEETCNKARALIRAAEEAVRYVATTL
ncbi:MAG: anthranilate synthase component I [Rhodospirillales bacterium]|nr:anthranilate synthase component I [Rhodospirillales bacterium]